jgi:hypothetical protein
MPRSWSDGGSVQSLADNYSFPGLRLVPGPERDGGPSVSQRGQPDYRWNETDETRGKWLCAVHAELVITIHTCPPMNRSSDLAAARDARPVALANAVWPRAGGPCDKSG